MLQQLSSQDASFLAQDTAFTPMHVGSVAILDPSTSPHGQVTLEIVCDYFEQRLHLMPTARRRLVNVPFGADHPYWVEDENFDLEYHMREVGLPEPHDWSQFYTLAARILARPLDLTRPPWEMYIIHGLDKLEGIPRGCIAMLNKTHHCAIDGASGLEMAMVLAELSPEGEPVPPPKTNWQPDPVPTDTELLTRAWGNNFMQPMRLAELLTQTGPAQQRMIQSQADELPSRATPVPRTRFNAPVTAQRTIGFERFSLDEVRAMKNEVEGATVNDVALSICGGALRRYLQAKFELPDEPLLAMAPISLRRDSADYSQGNQVSAMFVHIGTHLADPLERLVAVREETRNAKQIADAVGAEMMTRYGDFFPAAISNLAQRLTSEYARANQVAPVFNCSITNVPGPQVPLYSMGCRTVTTLGFGPVAHNMGLIIPISSYCGEFTLSFTSCREMIPDPDFFLSCINESFTALKAATLGADAEQKVRAIARNYEHMADAALEQVRATRAKAEAAS